MANELDIKTQEAIVNIDNLTKSVLRLQDGLILVEKEAKDVNNSFNTGKLSDYNKAQKQSVELQAKMAKSLLEVEKIRTQEQRTLNVLASTQAKNNREKDRSIDRNNRLEKSTATQTKRTLEANREFKKLEAELLRVTKAYQDMATKEGFASKNTQKLFRDVKRLRGEVDKIQQPIGNFNRNVGNYGTSLKNLASSGLAAAGIIGVVDTVIRIGESTFDTTRKLDSLNNAMLAVFETNEEVAKQNEFLTKIADNYGVEIITLTESYKGFSAAVKGTNLEGEKSQRIFDVITKTSAQLGLTTEQTEGALKALEQMISKGVVSAEELRGQLGERVPGAFRIFAEGLGVSTSKLGDMLKAGEIMADEALPKFADALEKAYSLDKIKRVDTLNSNISRLKNEFTNLVKGVNEGDMTLNDFANTTIKGLIILMEEWRLVFNDLGSDFSIVFNDIKQILNDLGVEFDDTIDFFDALRLTIRTSMIPLKGLTNIIKVLTGAISDLFDSGVSLGDMFSNNADRVLSLLNPINLLSNAFLGLKGNISEVKTESIDAVNAMNSAFGLVNKLKINTYTSTRSTNKNKSDTPKRTTNSGVNKDQIEADKAQKERLKLLKEERKELEKINDQLDENKDNYEVAVIKERVKDLREAQEAIEESLQKTSSDIGESSSIGMVDIEGDEQIKKMEQLMNIRDSIADGFSDLGLDSVANEFAVMFDTVTMKSDEFANKLEENSRKIASGLSVVISFASELFSRQSDDRIESLDRENEAFQENQDKKIEAIERQLEAENLSAEEKEALNSQIEVFESQKEEKEKQTKIRQFKSQQKADAQQALINGALGATQTIARLGVPFGIAPAGISLAFGALQSALILSKSVPEFFMGTQNAPEGYAYTQERGAEMITDKKGNVKTYGNNKGSQLTYLEKGDKVYTSGQTKDILSDVNSYDELFNSMILNKLTTPVINIDNGITESQMFSAIDRAIGKHSTPTYYNDNKTMFKVEAGKYPKAIGKVHHNKNNSYKRSKFN